MLTQKRLKEVLKYDPEAGIFTRRITISSRALVNSVAGYTNGNGYQRIRLDGGDYMLHRLAWLYIHGYFPEADIDHINRKRDDNRIINLREVSRTCNLRNAGIRSDNVSGVKGVCWSTRAAKWMAQIQINRKTLILCHSSNFLEAVCHRLVAEQAENWEGCDSSSPAHNYAMKEIRNVV